MVPLAFAICVLPGDLVPNPGHADWDILVTHQIELCIKLSAGDVVYNPFSG